MRACKILLFRACAGALVFSILLGRLSAGGLLAGAGAGLLLTNAVHPKEPDEKPFGGAWLLGYGARLLGDMALATARQMRAALRRELPAPEILHIRPAASGRGRVLVANSITLTPGTVTLEETAQDYAVLCACPPASGGERREVAAAFERRLRGKEGAPV